ncbi:hypothetical protein [Xanthomarina sp. F2636L]|uniref:hypothetical protein n=1 Tax=Xanthomarina sp. F2636L TaxID=2996018 RepID=UPI00225DF297|nr:hypothetical protein [Xanthomarina sp. F2636L]MCX7550743.1 hypothetical protein [Xanthomarina sp. F2636L]
MKELKKKSYLFISCDEAQHICDKAQYNEASSWEKVKLKLRYIWCRITRAYVTRNIKLTEAIKASKATCLNASEKEFLQQNLQQELKKQEQS